MKKHWAMLAAFVGAFALTGAAEAQFPNKTVRIVVPIRPAAKPIPRHVP